MKHFLTIAACVLGTGSLALAGSFNPELKPLGSMGNTRSEVVTHHPLTARGAKSQMNRVTPAVKRDFVEKTVKSHSLIQSYGWLTNNKPAKAEEGEGEEEEGNVTVNVTFTPVEGYEINPASVGIIDEATGALVTTIAPEEGATEFPASVKATLEADGDYSAMAYGELVKDEEVKAVVYYTTFEVTGETANLTIDFNQSTRKLAFQAYMGNGEPYPDYKPWSSGCGYNINYSSQLAYCGYYANFRVTSPMNFYIYCSELPGSANYSISYYANLFDDQLYSELSGGSAISGFDNPEEMIECIPASFYNNMSFSMSLSPTDKNIGKESLVSGAKADLAQLNEDGTFSLGSYAFSACFNDNTRQPVDSYSYYTWIPSSTIAAGVQTNMVFNGFGAYDRWSYKYCGPHTRVSRVEYILPWEQQWNVEKETWTPFSSIDRFNIRPEEQDIQNFVYPLFANSYFEVTTITDENGVLKIDDASTEAYYHGMFHEKMEFSDYYFIKSYTIDGEEKSFWDICDIDLSGTHSIDVVFWNPDGFVQNMFVTEGLNKLHITTANVDDMVPPRMIGLQMANGEGKIKTVFDADESANLLVSMYDRVTDRKPSMDFDVKLYAAAQESEEWVEITEPIVTEYDARLGKTYEFTLPTDGTLPADQWMKFKLVGEDASGNTNTMLLDYCFGIGNPNAGVNAIENDATDCAPVYYNLQGIRIAEPENGQIVIENVGGKTRKVIK